MSPPAWWLSKHAQMLEERAPVWSEDRIVAFIEAWNRGDTHPVLSLRFGIAGTSISGAVRNFRQRGYALKRYPHGLHRKGLTLILASLLAYGTLGAPIASAEVWKLRLGEPAPSEGVLIDQASAFRLVDDLRDAKALGAIHETVVGEMAVKDAEIVALRKQVEALTAEARAREIAQAVAEDREKRRLDDDARITKILERSEKALERTEKALERAQARIDTLEKRSLLTGFLLPLGIAASLFLGGAGFGH